MEATMLKRLVGILIVLAGMVLFTGLLYSEEEGYPPEVQKALEKADSNRAELGMVLAHYKNDIDTLKYQAACYLIANMDGHSYMIFGLYDSAKAEINFNVLDYPNYDSLQVAWATLEKAHPGLDFDKKELIDDLKTIKGNFLITQIDYAFRAWREKPWAKGMAFSDFCNYILPYRGSNEPLEDWRQVFFEKYKEIQAKMANPTDPIEAAKLINNDVKTWFTFDPRYYFHPTDQGANEMMTGHLGRCEDMTNAAIYAMRANGLGVTSDYTPYWANSGNNHAWNAIVSPDGKVIPFMGAEANPGEYSLWNKLAKVYRKMYSQQRDNLIFQTRKQIKVPAWLGGKSYIDVTKDYEKTSDVSIELSVLVPDSVDIAYICVFNDGLWKPIQWGRIYGNKVTFAGMGLSIAYLPAYFVTEDSIIPAGPPFILTELGQTEALAPDSASSSITIQLFSTTAKAPAPSTDGIKQVSFSSGKSYELFYWENGWKSAGKEVAAGQPLTMQVPTGCLYWLVEDNSNREERIFTINDKGEQVWW
jgi:hypothetical protein